MALSGFHEVIERAGAAAERVDRSRDEITLVAVSKGRTVDQIRELYELGHRDFGENRAAEMAEKVPQLPEDIRWHYVGMLQSNKARLVRDQTHLLHSMDRVSLAKSWLKGIGEPPPVMLQVNVGREEQKGGALPEDVSTLATRFVAMGLEVRGLMAIPPLGESAEESRPYFSALRELRDELRVELPTVDGLSMGMTNDFEVAIEEGASFIRVGRAIFESTVDRD